MSCSAAWPRPPRETVPRLYPQAVGLDPSELDSSVIARIPVRTNRDDRYFNDAFQAMPLRGFTRLFENTRDHPNITLCPGTSCREVVRKVKYREMVHSGPIDEFFDFRYGRLPCRSLNFRHERLNRDRFQPAAVVNYPNENAWSRITEFRCVTGQKLSRTSIAFEFPATEGDPCYPIPRPDNAAP